MASEPTSIGEPSSGRLTTEAVLPAVYEQLRRLAARLIAHERPGQTLQPTALVHEAYLRLSASPSSAHSDGAGSVPAWVSRQHFFIVAAETMRRILIDNSRRKHAEKRGGDWERLDLPLEQVAAPLAPTESLVLEEAVQRLRSTDATAADLVEHYYLEGSSVAEAAAAAGVPVRSAERLLAYARAWLIRELVL